MSAQCQLAVQLYTFREQLADDPVTVIADIADAGFVGVEMVCAAGMPAEVRDQAHPWMRHPLELKDMIEAHGLVVASAHTALPEGASADVVLDEQQQLGNDRLIISAPSVLPGGADDDLDRLDTLERLAERLNRAGELAAARGMRVGYHNHFWEWNISFDGKSAYELLWDRLDPSIVAEVDIYWAQVAGCDPAQVISALGQRAELVHVKDGPLAVGEPMTAVGSGDVDIMAALSTGRHVRWHIVEIDDCVGDAFQLVRQSARWLSQHGLSAGRAPTRNSRGTLG